MKRKKKDDVIYVVTVLKLDESKRFILRQRTWGWYQKFADAERAVLQNHGDIYETGYYDMAVIEEYPQGVLPIPKKETWYRATFKGRMCRGIYVRVPPTVVEIKKPKAVEGLISFGMG